MSGYSAPVAYAAAAPQLGIPAILDSDPLLQFKGARSVIKSLPAATGSSIGPSSQVQFLIPQSMNGFIKPGSMYIKCRITVDQVSDAAKTENFWGFAGQTYSPFGTDSGPSPASSVIDRLTVTFPGGVQMSYPCYDKFHWGIIMNHCLSREYCQTDLRELEQAHTIRDNRVAENVNSRTVLVCLPIDLPVFNSPSAVPLLLLSGGLTLDFITNSTTWAFTIPTSTANANDLTNFAISEMTLVYEELQVSPEFKKALQDKVAMQPYSIGISDRTWLGICDGSNSTRVNIGVGLSSMKALVGITIPSPANVRGLKNSICNQLQYWNMWVNGQQVNSMQLDSEVQNYAEFTRAIQSLFDINRVSDLASISNPSYSALRTSYPNGQFAFGLSTAVYSDANFALSGIPVDQLSVEFSRGATDGIKWGVFATGPVPSGNVTYLWALHDSVLTVLPDGTVSVRK